MESPEGAYNYCLIRRHFLSFMFVLLLITFLLPILPDKKVSIAPHYEQGRTPMCRRTSRQECFSAI